MTCMQIYPRRTVAELLHLDQIERQVWRGPYPQANLGGTVYGGHPLAQAMLAGGRDLGAGWIAHSLHCYFLRTGRIDQPIDYHVTALRDGRHFIARRIDVTQDGRLIAHVSASYHDGEPGDDRQWPMPGDLPAPEDCPSLPDYAASVADRLAPESASVYAIDFPIETRLIKPEEHCFKRPEGDRRGFWIRLPGAGDVTDALSCQALVGFLSDFWMMGVAMDPSRLSVERVRTQVGSIDHSIWFQRPVNPGNWLLHWTDSPGASGVRGMARGLLYDQSGTLAAVTAQEGLFRRL